MKLSQFVENLKTSQKFTISEESLTLQVVSLKNELQGQLKSAEKQKASEEEIQKIKNKPRVIITDGYFILNKRNDAIAVSTKIYDVNTESFTEIKSDIYFSDFCKTVDIEHYEMK